MSSFLAARRIFWIQLVITLSAAGIAGFVTDVRAAVSAGAGGGISVFVTAVFACLTFAAGPGASAAKVARALYLGEAVKFLLTGALFAGALIAFDVAFLPFILTYVATLSAYWLALPLTLDAR